MLPYEVFLMIMKELVADAEKKAIGNQAWGLGYFRGHVDGDRLCSGLMGEVVLAGETQDTNDDGSDAVDDKSETYESEDDDDDDEEDDDNSTNDGANEEVSNSAEGENDDDEYDRDTDGADELQPYFYVYGPGLTQKRRYALIRLPSQISRDTRALVHAVFPRLPWRLESPERCSSLELHLWDVYDFLCVVLRTEFTETYKNIDFNDEYRKRLAFYEMLREMVDGHQ
ncbi:hypothetical protein CSOJ01_10171 [Colletotrichum sojae]|uniref:Uncharacterized protein n=1 Tax=Colletotrichum sojae TaxID=2175907 RepID=A0A8H6J0Y1_9PEZI|nr:hypothetical protein CSOJ01_10171 [Colletotrichum sojae]